jgi:hypothetical protein
MQWKKNQGRFRHVGSDHSLVSLVHKSFNHELSLHMQTSDPPSTTDLLLLSPSDNWTSHSVVLSVRRLLPFSWLFWPPTSNTPIALATITLVIYIYSGRAHRKSRARVRILGVDYIENTSCVIRMRVYWIVAQHWAWRGPHRKYFFQCPF